MGLGFESQRNHRSTLSEIRRAYFILLYVLSSPEGRKPFLTRSALFRNFCHTSISSSSKWRGVSPLPSLGTVLDSLPSHGSSYLLIVNNKLPLLPSHPVFGWTSDLIKYVAPFAPPPLQGLQHYYEAIRHRKGHRYFLPCVSALSAFSLNIPPLLLTFLERACIKFMPSICRAPD